MQQPPVISHTMDDSGRTISGAAVDYESAAHPAGPTVHPEWAGAASRRHVAEPGEQSSQLPARPARVHEIQGSLQRRGVDDYLELDVERQRPEEIIENHELRILSASTADSSIHRRSIRTRLGFHWTGGRSPIDARETKTRECQSSWSLACYNHFL